MTVDPAPPGFDDWAALHRLLREAFAFMDARIDPPSSMHRLDADALAAKAADERLILARDDDGTLVGCLFLRPAGERFYLGKLAVRRERRGDGTGRALVRRARHLAAEEGGHELELQVRVELVENHRFFERLGFRKTGESAHAGYARATSITMRAPVLPTPGATAAPDR